MLPEIPRPYFTKIKQLTMGEILTLRRDMQISKGWMLDIKNHRIHSAEPKIRVLNQFALKWNLTHEEALDFYFEFIQVWEDQDA